MYLAIEVQICTYKTYIHTYIPGVGDGVCQVFNGGCDLRHVWVKDLVSKELVDRVQSHPRHRARHSLRTDHVQERRQERLRIKRVQR